MTQVLEKLRRHPAVRNPVKALFIGAIRGYQTFISPGLPGRCRYYPSCSQYAIDAIREYGPLRGVILGGWRILRCNPLSNGGYDPASRQRLFRARGSHDTPAHCCSATPVSGKLADSGGSAVATGVRSTAAAHGRPRLGA